MSRIGRSVLVSITLALAALPAAAQNQLWARQLGTAGDDEALLAVPGESGAVYVGGVTSSGLGGPHAGGRDAWFARYDGAGTQLWLRQIGTSSHDSADAGAPSSSGGVFLAGSTRGNLGDTNAGGYDAWLARYDSAGNQIWIRQLGTSNDDSALAAAPDSLGGVYVCGTTASELGGSNMGGLDAWLARYDSSGNQIWIKQLGSSKSDVLDTAIPDAAGGVIVGGSTEGSLGGPNKGGNDAWFARYDNAGNQLWIRQHGTSTNDFANCAAPDGSGGVYIAGHALRTLNEDTYDAWLAHHDSAGNQLWIQRLGSTSWDYAFAATADGSGGVFVSGITSGDLGGSAAGAPNVWLAHFDSTGNLPWIRQVGTSDIDYAWAAASDGAGGVLIGGYTKGSLGGPHQGVRDAWLARFDNAGCLAPTTYCTAQTSSSGCVPAISASGVPSLAAPSMFSVTSSNLEVSQDGVMFFGSTGPNALPFGGGTLCVKSPLYRLKIKNSGGSATCTGSLSYTLLEMLAQPLGGPLLTGYQAVHMQAWFRDPSHPSTTGSSNGLQLSICP